MPNSTTKPITDKIAKPHKDFPLTPHKGAKQWCKKIARKIWYFGPLADPEGALRRYLDEKDDILAGRTPRTRTDGLRLHELVNRYLTAKEQARDNGELTPRTWHDYDQTCIKVLKFFGRERAIADITAEDFGTFKASLYRSGLGHVSVANEIRRTRGLFKWGYDAGLVKDMPRYGQEFRRPAVRLLRLERANRPARLFSAEQIRRMIDASPTVTLQAIVLLGINCALGNHDIDELETRHLDLDRGILDFPRPKTGIDRRAILWPETVKALLAVLSDRPKPKDGADKDKVFITRCGARFVRFNAGRRVDAVHRIFAQLLRDLGIKKTGVSYYSLRHTFRDVADETGDQRAIDRVMGHHRESDIANVYRHTIRDERLKQVADHVHGWLFGKQEGSHD